MAVEDLMASFALSLRDRGRWVRGAVATSLWRSGEGAVPALFDLDSGNTYALPGGVAGETHAARRRKMPEILAVMQGIVCEGADLAVFHRFSAAEAEGMGFAAEMSLLIAAGIPFLTTVERDQVAAWRAFAGSGAVLLPPSLPAMFAWAEAAWAGTGRRPLPHSPGVSGVAAGAVLH